MSISFKLTNFYVQPNSSITLKFYFHKFTKKKHHKLARCWLEAEGQPSRPSPCEFRETCWSGRPKSWRRWSCTGTCWWNRIRTPPAVYRSSPIPGPWTKSGLSGVWPAAGCRTATDMIICYEKKDQLLRYDI